MVRPMSANQIWIVDDIQTRPGQGAAFLQSYLENYAPAATARGMRLVHKMVEPAMWLDDASNRLLLVWAVADPGAVWGSKQVARMTPEVERFWQETAPPFILSRSRSVMAESDELEALGNV